MTFPHNFPTASDLSDAAAFPVKFPRHAVDLPDPAAFPAKFRVASPPSYTGPLDLTATPAVVAYGQRAMSAAKLGTAVYTIRRSSDNTTQSFSSDATTGAVDATAISAFIGGGSGFVTVWNDQSGNASNAVQATSAHQPQWTAALLNSIPGFVGVSTSAGGLDTAGNVSFPNGAATVFLVCGRNIDLLVGDYGGSYIDVFTGNGEGGSPYNQPYLDMYDTTNEAGGNFADFTGVNLIDGAWHSGGRDMYVNGVALALGGTSFDAGGAVGAISQPLHLNLINSVGPPAITANILEVLPFSTILSDADRLAIRQNIATYYGITL